jgi:hypothetical protein
MSNMSYCRFHNTKMDLEDCLDALRDEGIESKSELNKGIRMFEMFLEFCEDEGIIENFDKEIVKEVLENAYKDKEEDD